MMAGVVMPPDGHGTFPKSHPAYMNLTTNKAAVAVGITSQSSSELMLGDRKGKCLTVVHYYGDRLCHLDHFKCPSVPALGPPDFLVPRTFVEEFPALGQKPVQPSADQNSDSLELPPVEDVAPVKSEVEQMDELLVQCMLTILKYSKSLTLPILTSNFYKQMIGVCPEGKCLDVKKSSFKKVGAFIQGMCKVCILYIFSLS